MSSRMTFEQLQANLATNPALARANRDNQDEAVQAVTVEARPTHAGGPIPGEKAAGPSRTPRAVTPGRDDSPLVLRQPFSSRDEDQP